MYAIGVDLGGTNSKLFFWEAEEQLDFQDEGTSISIPSMIYVNEDDAIITGKKAMKLAAQKPKQAIQLSKKSWFEPNWNKKVGGIKYSLVETLGEIISSLKFKGEQESGELIQKAVFAIPAYFQDQEKKLIERAAKLAGIEPLALIPEPVCALTGLELEPEFDKKKNFLVLDVGGQTLDISLANTVGTTPSITHFEEVTFLGGDNFTEIIIRFLRKEFKEIHEQALPKTSEIKRVLRDKAERTLRRINRSNSVPISCIDLLEDKSIEIDLTRDQLAVLLTPLFKKIKKSIDSFLKKAEIKVEEIDNILLCGGGVKNILFQRFIAENYTQQIIKKNEDHCVVHGAVLACFRLLAPITDTKIIDTPTDHKLRQSVGIDLYDNRKEQRVFFPILKKGIKLPAKKVSWGFIPADQLYVLLNIYRGEFINQLFRNTHVGVFQWQISNDLKKGSANGVALIFELDEFDKLVISGVEVPMTRKIKNDPALLAILKEAQHNNNLVSYENLSFLIEKYHLRKQQRTITLE